MSRTAANALEAWLIQANQARPAGPGSLHSNPTLAPLLPGTAEPSAAPFRLANTDWLHHRLTISGPVAEMAALQALAAGSGTIPWHFGLDRVEEGWFHLLAAPPALQERTLSVAGARILAAQLREAVGRRHALAVAQAAGARRCPFDLHALLRCPARCSGADPTTPRRWPCCGNTGSRRRRCATSPCTHWLDRRVQLGGTSLREDGGRRGLGSAAAM